MTRTAIDCAFEEAAGNGLFRNFGKRIVFTHNNGSQHIWWAATSKQAREQIALFRAAPRYVVR